MIRYTSIPYRYKKYRWKKPVRNSYRFLALVILYADFFRICNLQQHTKFVMRIWFFSDERARVLPRVLGAARRRVKMCQGQPVLNLAAHWPRFALAVHTKHFQFLTQIRRMLSSLVWNSRFTRTKHRSCDVFFCSSSFLPDPIWYMGRVSVLLLDPAWNMGRVSVSVYLSVCKCFQWFLFDDRSPLLVD